MLALSVGMLTIEKSRLILQETRNWFGPQAIIFSIDGSLPGNWSRDNVVDGLTRLRVACELNLTETIKACVTFTHDIHSRAVIRELMLRGHYERALSLLPQEWSHSVLDVEAYTGLPRSECFQVFAARKRIKPKPVQLRRRDNEVIIERLQSMFDSFDEGELSLELNDIRRVLNEPTSVRQDSKRADSRDVDESADIENPKR